MALLPVSQYTYTVMEICGQKVAIRPVHSVIYKWHNSDDNCHAVNVSIDEEAITV